VVKRDRIGVFLFAIAGSFYIPVAFLVYQQYTNYLALPILFVSASIIYVLIRYSKAPALVYMVVLCHLVIGIKGNRQLYDLPARGYYERSFIERINQLDLKGYQRVCLKSVEPLRTNKTGVAYWNISPFWHSLGDGAALKLFGSVRADYQPPDAAPCLDQPTIVLDKRFDIVSIVFPHM
jgi:hypothetical protein